MENLLLTANILSLSYVAIFQPEVGRVDRKSIMATGKLPFALIF